MIFMFSPNCVVVLPFPEISIKSSSVRRFMLKALKENMSLCLKHENIDYKFFSENNRFIISTSNPLGCCSALRDCFGISGLFPSVSISFSSLEDLSTRVAQLCEGKFKNCSFAVRGKSYSDDFSSKDLEISVGAKIIETISNLSVKLKSPEKEVFCIVSDKRALVYFDSLPCASGLPVGVQGRAVLLIDSASERNQIISLAKNLLYSGCSVAFLSQKETVLFKELESFNGFRKIPFVGLSDVKKHFASGRVKAFFSCADSHELLSRDNALIETKCFAPLLF